MLFVHLIDVASWDEHNGKIIASVTMSNSS